MFDLRFLPAVLLAAVLEPGGAVASQILVPSLDEYVSSPTANEGSPFSSAIQQAGRASAAKLDFGPNFPLPASLAPNVDFWIGVYSRYSAKQWILHDKENLSIVYEVINGEDALPGAGLDSYKFKNHISQRRKRISAILKSLYQNKGVASNPEEARVANALPVRLTSLAMYKSLAGGVRGQRGQADRFIEGLRQSGQYQERMKKVFRQNGLPEELTMLPHVESSFNYEAYSKAGAAGIWQFTRGTGRRFLRIDYAVDERLDPVISTYAAARLLKINHETLGSWPLALIAYNHGLNGMSRAVNRHGADLAEILESYQSRAFGFASKNFYAEFLAALEVSRNHPKYFGPVDFLPEARYDEITLARDIPAEDFINAAGIPGERLRAFNQALTDVVWRGRKYIPKGYQMKVPEGAGGQTLAALEKTPVKQAPRGEREITHLVRRGESAKGIAKRYGLTAKVLLDANGVDSKSVRRGMSLIVPVSGGWRGSPATNKTDSGYYFAVEGDTLAKIAQDKGLTAETLAKINGLTPDSQVFTGQKLVVMEDLAITTTKYEKAAANPPSAPNVAASPPSKDNILVAMEKAPAQNSAAKAPAPVAAAPLVEAKGSGPEFIHPDSPAKSQAESQSSGASTKDAAEPAPQTPARGLRIDPSIYSLFSVNGDEGVIKVASEETMALYADWAGVGLSRVRKMNDGKKNPAMGAKIKIPLDKTAQAEFERKRVAYHAAMLDRFLASYEVRDEKKVVVKPGASVWRLCVLDNKTPMWLAQLYNPDKEMAKLAPGDTLILPAFVRK
jgi:membrane-bound lytic murein transglycosylase D